MSAIATFLVLILAARITHPFYRHLDAVDAVKQMGGQCKQKWRRSPLRAIGSLDVEPDDFIPVDEIELGSLFRYAGLTEDGMRRACQLSGVTSMEIWCDRCDKRCLAHLQRLPELRALVIRCREIDDGGLLQLADLSTLEELDVYGNLIDAPDTGFDRLKRRLSGGNLNLELEIQGRESAERPAAECVVEHLPPGPTTLRVKWFAKR